MRAGHGEAKWDRLRQTCDSIPGRWQGPIKKIRASRHDLGRRIKRQRPVPPLVVIGSQRWANARCDHRADNPRLKDVLKRLQTTLGDSFANMGMVKNHDIVTGA